MPSAARAGSVQASSRSSIAAAGYCSPHAPGRSADRRARSASRARSSPRSARSGRLGQGTALVVRRGRPGPRRRAISATSASTPRPCRSGRRRCAPRRCRTHGAAGRSTRAGCAPRSSWCAAGKLDVARRTRPSSPNGSGMPQRGKLCGEDLRSGSSAGRVARRPGTASWPRAPGARAARCASRSQTAIARSAPATPTCTCSAEGVVAPRHVLRAPPRPAGSARCR